MNAFESLTQAATLIDIFLSHLEEEGLDEEQKQETLSELYQLVTAAAAVLEAMGVEE